MYKKAIGSTSHNDRYHIEKDKKHSTPPAAFNFPQGIAYSSKTYP